MPSRTETDVEEQEVLTAQEVAKKLRVTPRTVQGMASSGALPAFRVGRLWRFNAEDVHSLMEPQKGKTKNPGLDDMAEKISAFEAGIGVRTASKPVSSLDELLGPRNRKPSAKD